MDIDKLVALLKTFGFPAAMAGWLLYLVQTHLSHIAVAQNTIVELLRQLVELHK